MGNCCFPIKKTLTDSLLNDSYDFQENSNSDLLESNIKEISNRIFRVEERCGEVFTQFSSDIKFLHNSLNELQNEVKPTKNL